MSSLCIASPHRFFAAILLKGEPFSFDPTLLMALLVVANVVLIFGAVAIQYAAGSAALEAELKMMELNLRETETRLSVAEMRADLDTLQRMAGVETRADAARRWRAARSDISLATSKSFSISTTAASECEA